MSQKYGFLDLDGVAYIGACIAEKVAYQWVTKEGVTPQQKSEEFPKAKIAKEWFEERVGFEEIDPAEWERLSIPKIQDLSVALKATDDELKKWIKSCHDLFAKDLIFKGFLTPSGIKIKDVHDLQHRYQHTRFANFKEAVGTDYENWKSKPKPLYLVECRNHLIKTYDWIKMAPRGWEADALVIGMGERYGQDAVIGLKDKDLMQIMNSNFINMNTLPKSRVLVSNNELGTIELKEARNGTKSIEATGFKLIACQTPQGDASDGYKGVHGFGPVDAFEMFEDADSPEECCKRLCEYYEGKFPDGITYEAWQESGKMITLNWQELLVQHMRLAYHERGSKDLLTPVQRYWKGEPVVWVA